MDEIDEFEKWMDEEEEAKEMWERFQFFPKKEKRKSSIKKPNYIFRTPGQLKLF